MLLMQLEQWLLNMHRQVAVYVVRCCVYNGDNSHLTASSPIEEVLLLFHWFTIKIEAQNLLELGIQNGYKSVKVYLWFWDLRDAAFHLQLGLDFIFEDLCVYV